MNRLLIRRLMLFVAGIMMSSILFGQQITVTGTVTDALEGISLPGVNVLVKGTTRGTTTNADGEYSIEVSPDATLVFSFIGYIEQEVPVNNRTTINVELEYDVMQIAEVVTIGYGTTPKKDATGSVSAVKAEDFNRGQITSPQQLVVGKIAGVQITDGGGAPGEGARIRIRGGSSLSASNDPLIVIDGVPLDNEGISGMRNPLNTIHPSDIETFTVLKDASATAIYGLRASNGVIIIETKKGRAGQPMEINYNGSVSVSSRFNQVDVFGADEYRELVLDKYAGNSNVTDLLGTASTDWQDEIYRTSVSHDHNLNFSGAYKNLPYRVSLSYSDMDGILKTDNLKRATGSLNLNPSFLDDHLTVDLNVKGMNVDNTFANRGAIGGAVSMDPTHPVYDEDSPYGGYFTWTNPDGSPFFTATTNPMAQLMMRDDVSTVNRIIGNVQVEYKMHFLPELSARLNVGHDGSSSNGDIIVPQEAPWGYDPVNGGGEKSTYTQGKQNSLLDFYFTYNKELPQISSRINAVGGYSWQHFYREGTYYSTNFNETVLNQDTDYKTESYLVSFFGRLNYVFMDRYLVTVTLRQDGSSKFSPETRWELFPSVALAWNIAEEEFMSGSPVSDLKLRLGYGVTGQQDISANDYPYQARYTYSEDNARYLFGNTFITTLRPEGYDVNLKWEETDTYNVGLDFGFLNNRITGAIDAYYRFTRDLINVIPVPAGTNLTNQILTNVGNMENRGIEFTINGIIISKPDFSWDAGFNLTYNENKITRLTQVDDPDYEGVMIGGISGAVGNTIQIHSVGHPHYSFYVWEQVYNQDGEPIEGLYVDRNGDGAITVEDRYRYKDPDPNIFMGFNSMVRYKNFDFSFNGRVALGNYVYNNTFSNSGSYASIYLSGCLGNANRNLLETQFENPKYFSDYYIENGSYLKIDNASLGYNFDNLLAGKLNLRLYTSAENLLLITKYRGLDPEVASGIDNNLYPRPRIFLFGVSLTY
ncbi:MAG: SusC/RagA family TonB-linked outer membrane protein [Bacteroidota bacterium]